MHSNLTACFFNIRRLRILGLYVMVSGFRWVNGSVYALYWELGMTLQFSLDCMTSIMVDMDTMGHHLSRHIAVALHLLLKRWPPISSRPGNPPLYWPATNARRTKEPPMKDHAFTTQLSCHFRLSIVGLAIPRRRLANEKSRFIGSRKDLRVANSSMSKPLLRKKEQPHTSCISGNS